MAQTLSIILLILNLVGLGLLGYLCVRRSGGAAADNSALEQATATLEKGQARLEQLLRDEMAANRRESTDSAKLARDETGAAIATLTAQFDGFRVAHVEAAEKLGTKVNQSVDTFAQKLGAQQTSSLNVAQEAQRVQLAAFETQLKNLVQSSKTDANIARQEMSAALTSLAESVAKNVNGMGESQRGHFDSFATRIDKMAEGTEKRQEALRLVVAEGLAKLQAANDAKLEQMRVTVDEKLQGTLDKRLGESFKTVSQQLEQVHQGLGEMRTLTSGVGDLKKVLTNIKTRGNWGEIQLGKLLEQFLAPGQYQSNVAVKAHSGERVEFAIVLPGRDDAGGCVYLPIDSKFPQEDYSRLLDAQEAADLPAVEAAFKNLDTQIRQCAATIAAKYIDPPGTTDFAIMFLPTEGLYAEVIRRGALVELLQREHRIVVAGPTTLVAILNSLQMGFRSLAIQKRSSEVWKVLGAVKTEFGKFGQVLESVNKKLDEARNKISEATTRTSVINRKLRGVEEMPEAEARVLLDGAGQAGFGEATDIVAATAVIEQGEVDDDLALELTPAAPQPHRTTAG